MNHLFAGIDISTQSCKLVVINADDRTIIHIDSVNYDDDLPQYDTRNGILQNQAEGVSESDPRMWIDAVNLVFERFVKTGIEPDSIREIAVSGQQHGLVALDEKGNLARPASKLWNDFSTSEECRLLTEKIGGTEAMIAEVGNTQRPGYTAGKIYHFLRHEPEAYKRTAVFLLVHNYINWYLTGGVCLMEPGDVSGTALWHPEKQAWSEQVIRAIDPSLQARLPQVRPSSQSIGRISDDLVRRFGFAPDCLIDSGSGDNMYGAVGTGNVRSGIVTLSLGTSGTAYSFMEKAFIDPAGEIAAFCDATGHHLPLLCVSNMAGGYNDVLSTFQLDHNQFVDIVNKTHPGNGGRLIIPWYEGERTPDLPRAAPIYFGFGLDDFTREYLCRGVLEGHVLNIYQGFRRLPVTVDEIRLTGGLSQSAAWCQTIADIFEAEVIPIEGEGAALGAALHAAWVWGLENSREEPLTAITDSFIKIDESRRFRPDAEHTQIYRKQKAVFEALSKRVRGLTGADPFKKRMELLARLGRPHS